MKTIGVLGCGWLGFPLAKRLLAQGYIVKGSTTREEKLPVLREAGIDSYRIRVSSEGVDGNVAGFLDGVGTIIIDFPPGLRKDPEKDYPKSIQKLTEEIVKAGISRAIFISSTSVYEETESFRIYSEDTIPNATSGSSQKLIAAEEILSTHSSLNSTVVRFGGLIGPGRHPVNYLAGRRNIPNPLGPVNLIHLEDCIGIIERIIKKEEYGKIYNAVYPVNPPREKYYQARAEQNGLDTPNFDHSSPSVGKVISSSKLMRELEYEFKIKI